jgi:hypothetical protein
MADIQAASERLRILIRAMHSGGPHSSLLSSALYDDFILLILGKLVGEGQPANLLGASACWLDAIAGCRLEDFTEAREAGDVALLKTFTEAEQKACIAGMNVEALLDVAAVTSSSSRPAGASVAQLQESLFADVGRTARTFLLGPEMLPPATKLILDATAGTAPNPLGPVQRELFTRTEPLLAVLQANADRLTAGEFVMLPPMDTITNPRRAGAAGAGGKAAEWRVRRSAGPARLLLRTLRGVRLPARAGAARIPARGAHRRPRFCCSDALLCPSVRTSHQRCVRCCARRPAAGRQRRHLLPAAAGVLWGDAIPGDAIPLVRHGAAHQHEADAPAQGLAAGCGAGVLAAA